jgi:hypothetical protein
VLATPALCLMMENAMKVVGEIRSSEAMEHFLARPRLALGALIFVAGTALLVTEACKVFYR